VVDRRTLLKGSVAYVGSLQFRPGINAVGADESELFLVTSSGSNTVEFVNGVTGEYSTLEVGASPWGLAVGPGRIAFAATGEGVAEFDTLHRRLNSVTPYSSWSGEISYGEYRPAGMGIAVAPDGSTTYTGVYLPEGDSLLEVMNVESKQVVAAVPIGLRPFQVLVSKDGAFVFTIDHDSYSVTVLDTDTKKTVTRKVAPLGDVNGLSGFGKPHYAALAENGDLLLPFQGQTLLRVDPLTGESSLQPLTANTHQHGIALSPDGSLAAIVGTGAAGGATNGPSLTILEIETGTEQIVPLDRQHEQAIWSHDRRRVVLTGGYTFGAGGWNGLTLFDFETENITEWELGSLPLEIARLPSGGSSG